MTNAIARISAAKRALSRASSLDEVLEIRDKAEAIRVYIKAAAESLEVQNTAADIKLRAERKAGEMLAAMELQEGARTPRSNTMLPRLDDLGISKMQSSRWQLAAKLPEDDYLSLVSACSDAKKELTQSAVLRAARIYAFGDADTDEDSGPQQQGKNESLLDLISMARTAVGELVAAFGASNLQTLIGVLKDEIETLEASVNGND